MEASGFVSIGSMTEGFEVLKSWGVGLISAAGLPASRSIWLLQGFFRAPWVARDFGISVEDVRSPPTHGNSGLQELRG